MALNALFFLLLSMALSIISINCNGLRSTKKIDHVFTFFHIRKFDIMCLQETFWDDDFVTNSVSTKWDGEIYFSNFQGITTKQSKGVAILFRHGLDLKIDSATEIIKGRALEVHFETEDNNFRIFSLYAPNNVHDRSKFFQDISTSLTGVATDDNTIVAGDYNVVTDSIDRSSKMHSDPSRSKFLQLLNSNFLEDIWRKQHPTTIEYTWRRYRKNNKLSQSRIDKILINQHNSQCAITTSIIPFTWSDHDIVQVCYNPNNVSIGPGVWKFNKTLLTDEEFCTAIKSCITNFKQKPSYNESTFEWYEELKTRFKNIAIYHSKKNAKELYRHRKDLEKKIKFEYKKANKYPNYDLSTVKVLEKELLSLDEHECRGAALRAKITDFEKNEKPTRYFFNLEKSIQKKKIMSKIQSLKGSILNTSEEILKEAHDFFSKLYQPNYISARDCEIQSSFIDNINTSLDDHEKMICSNPLCLSELFTAVTKMEPNHSPGPDGLTAEFFKYFFDDLGPVILKVANSVFESNSMPETMRHGIITLVPKKGDKTSLKNWRPISLLNVDYKIIAKALAARLSQVMGNIISPDQTCCIKGRDISDNVLAMHDLLDFISENNRDGYLIKIDQQKAFDRVNHRYLIKVLEKFDFPEYFVKWVSIFYTEVKSSVKINGYLTEPLSIRRGIRQGCPLSAMLYVLTAEPMRNAIVNNADIRGICLEEKQNTEALIFQHADDTTIFVENAESVKQVFKIFQEYSSASGSKVNFEKSEILTFGRSSNFQIGSCDIQFNKPDCTKILGLHIGSNKNLCQQENWAKIVTSCKNVLNSWRPRNLTIKGKVLVVNTLIISKVIYTLNLSNIPLWVVHELKKAITDFIWNGKSHRIRYSVLINPVCFGGLRLIDLQRMKCALRCKIIRKIYDQENILNPVTKYLIEYNLSKYKNLNLGRDTLRIKVEQINLKSMPPFYRELLESWVDLTQHNYVEPLNACEILNQPIFENPFIDIRSNDLAKPFAKAGVIRIKDIILEYAPGFISPSALHELLDSNLSNIQVSNILSEIIKEMPASWRKKIYSSALRDLASSPSRCNFLNSISGSFIDITSTTTKDINEYLRTRDADTPAGVTYWRDQFGDDDLTIPFFTCFGGLKETYMGQTDFFLAHNVLYTNDKLVTFKFSNDTRCTLCKDDTESIPHLFLNCDKTQNLYFLTLDLCQTIVGKSIQTDKFVKMILFGFTTLKPKDVHNLVNFVLSMYRTTIWSTRSWRKKGQAVNPRHIFRSLIKKRIALEFQAHKQTDSIDTFFDIFGINEALIYSTPRDYNIAFY